MACEQVGVHVQKRKIKLGKSKIPPHERGISDEALRAAEEKLNTRQSLKNPDDWVVVWVMGQEKKPWPIFVRVGGKNEQGKPGIKEGNYVEVLEWQKDKELDGKLKAGEESTYPELIIATPPPKLSIFERGQTFKIS